MKREPIMGTLKAKEIKNFDFVLGEIAYYLPNDLFSELFDLPSNTPLEVLKSKIEESLPKEYPSRKVIMDILTRALS